MNEQLSRRRGYAHAARWLVVASAFASVLSLGACSSTPDWANPIEWYKGATSVFDSDKEPAPPAKSEEAADLMNRPVPGAGQPFPNLASVPERPKSVTPPAERRRITESLVADRDNARYVDPPPRPAPSPSRPLTRADSPPSVAASPPPTGGAAPFEPPSSPPSSSPAPSGGAAFEPPPPPPAAAAPSPRPAQQSQASAPAVAAAPRPRVADTPPPPPPPAVAAPPDVVAANPAPSAGPPRLNGPQPDAVVLFNDGSSQISAEQRRGLEAVVRDAKARNATVRVVGRSSPPKTQSQAALLANFNASWNRAHAVADVLTRLGIPPAQLRVEAETSPEAAPTVASVPRGDAGMRRADIYLE